MASVLSGACCHTGTNRERGEWGGEGEGEGLWFRYDITQWPVSRPIGGTGAGFYQKSSHLGKGTEYHIDLYDFKNMYTVTKP